MQKLKCAICDSKNAESRLIEAVLFQVSCEVCGSYEITYEAESDLRREDLSERIVISG